MITTDLVAPVPEPLVVRMGRRRTRFTRAPRVSAVSAAEALRLSESIGALAACRALRC